MESDEFNIESGSTSNLRWSMMRLPKEGEQRCGDVHLIKKYSDKVLIAAIDGLGHGKSAAHASERARYLLKSFNDESLINLVKHCHQKLRNTRGVVMSLALIDFRLQQITWMGVGNVQGVLLQDNDEDEFNTESIILKHGIVGYKLPPLQAAILPISIGDMLILTTDGVKNDYISEVNIDKSPEEVVEHIASNHFKESDDALILAAKFVGKTVDEQKE